MRYLYSLNFVVLIKARGLKGSSLLGDFNEE
jgi:hypothetical protein